MFGNSPVKPFISTLRHIDAQVANASITPEISYTAQVRSAVDQLVRAITQKEELTQRAVLKIFEEYTDQTVLKYLDKGNPLKGLLQGTLADNPKTAKVHDLFVSHLGGAGREALLCFADKLGVETQNSKIQSPFRSAAHSQIPTSSFTQPAYYLTASAPSFAPFDQPAQLQAPIAIPTDPIAKIYATGAATLTMLDKAHDVEVANRREATATSRARADVDVAVGMHINGNLAVDLEEQRSANLSREVAEQRLKEVAKMHANLAANYRDAVTN